MDELKPLKDFQGYTPLHLNAENGHFDECKTRILVVPSNETTRTNST